MVWDAGEKHGFQWHVEMQLQRDESQSEVVKRARTESNDKRAERAAKDETKADKVVELIEEKPTRSPKTIQNSTGTSGAKVIKLATGRGWEWSGEQWQRKKGYASEEPQ